MTIICNVVTVFSSMMRLILLRTATYLNYLGEMDHHICNCACRNHFKKSTTFGHVTRFLRWHHKDKCNFDLVSNSQFFMMPFWKNEFPSLASQDISVEFEFIRTVESIQEKRPDFTVTYGTQLRVGNTAEDIKKNPATYNSPIVLMREHVLIRDFRLIDILARLDEEGRKSVTEEQFVQALDVSDAKMRTCTWFRIFRFSMRLYLSTVNISADSSC